MSTEQTNSQMLSAIVTSIVGIMKALNKLSTDNDTLLKVQQEQEQKLHELSHSILGLKTQTQTLSNDLQDKITIQQQTISELVNILTENAEPESLSEVKQHLLNELKPIDYTTIIETLVDAITVNQQSFELETNRMKQVSQQIQTLQNNFEKLTKSNETLSARVESIDIRTANFYNSQVMETNDMTNMTETISMLQTTLENLPQVDF